MQRKNSIEIIGLPGSGKSTLAKALQYENIFHIVTLHNRVEKYFFFILFFFLHPFFIWRYTRLINKQPDILKKYIRHLFFISCAKEMKAIITSFVSSKIQLIDEGLFQRFLSIFDSVKSEKEISQYLSHLPRWKKNVIFVEGSGFDRFLHEPDSVFSPRIKMGEVYLKNWVETLKTNFISLKNSISQTYKYVIFDNNDRSVVATKKLLEEVIRVFN